MLLLPHIQASRLSQIIAPLRALKTFKPFSESQILNIINSLSSKKATGVDLIPPKILKAAAEVLSGPISSIFNKGVSQNQFPDRIKVAQVSPNFQKGWSFY